MTNIVSEESVRGVVRKLDNLGRLVIPREFRKMLGADCGDAVEMKFVGNMVTVKPYTAKGLCIFCGETTEYMYKEKSVCQECCDGLNSENERED